MLDHNVTTGFMGDNTKEDSCLLLWHEKEISVHELLEIMRFVTKKKKKQDRAHSMHGT